jgi:hypothetical protein
MAIPKIMHGARALVQVFDPLTNTTITVGTWSSFGYRVVYDVQAAFILGRYSAAALVTVGVEPVMIDAGGWRVVDHGPYVDGRLRNIKDLLNEDYLLLQVQDRQDPTKIVATIQGCLPTGTSAQLSERQLETSTNSYMGLLYGDESVDSQEAPDANQLP